MSQSAFAGSQRFRLCSRVACVEESRVRWPCGGGRGRWNSLIPVDPHLWGCGRQSSPGILEPSASAWHQQLQPMGLLPIETRRARTRKSFADRRREPISTFGLERRCRATCILWQHGHRAAWRFRWASRPLPENLRAFSFPCGFAWSSAGGYLNRTESKLSHASC